MKRSTGYLNKILFLSLCLVLFYCSKEGTNNNVSIPFLDNNFKDKIIIVAGSTLSDGAVLWINDKNIKLIGDALEATGLFYYNERIYVTGWQYGGNGSVWTMNKDGSDQTHIELEGKYSEGQRILVHNDISMLEVIMIKVHVIGKWKQNQPYN